jgi:cytochrome c7-like protein
MLSTRKRDRPSHLSLTTGGSKSPPTALLVSLFSLILIAATPAPAHENRSVEHPGSLDSRDNCSSCHADKAKGKSVHAAMALSCTVCHLAETRGDMTTLTLLMPKPKICFACHEEALSKRQHSSATKGLCLDCHEAHSSKRRLLLRDRN